MIYLSSRPKKDNDPHTFSEALHEVKLNRRIARAGWNGKGMYVFLVEAKEVDGVKCDAYLAMKTVQNTYVPWLASQTDILAEDWIIQ